MSEMPTDYSILMDKNVKKLCFLVMEKEKVIHLKNYDGAKKLIVAPFGRHVRGMSYRQLHSLRSLASGYENHVMWADCGALASAVLGDVFPPCCAPLRALAWGYAWFRTPAMPLRG